MADTGQELIEAALAAVEDRVQQQIEAARQRRERDRQQRQQLAAARNAGLGRRHAQKLRNLARTDAGQEPGSPSRPPSPTPGDLTSQAPARTRASSHVNRYNPPPARETPEPFGDQPRDRAGAGHAHARAGGDQ